MADGFSAMWRRNSTSSDEPDQARSECAEDDTLPQRSHSDEPRFYRPVNNVQVAKRSRSSSPDLDGDRVNNKRRSMSEASADINKQPDNFNPSLSPSPANYDADSSKKCDVIDLDRKLPHNASTIHRPLRADLPVLTLPSTVYAANVLYGHAQSHLDLRRHVTSPRLLSPSFVRPSVSSPAQVRQLLQEHAVTPSHMFAQQLRQDFAGMATMFPYTFTHPLPRNELLTSRFKKLASEFEQTSPATEETSDRIADAEAQKERNDNKENEPNDIEKSFSPHSEPRSSPKNDALGKSRSSSFENLKSPNEQADGQSNEIEGICSDLSIVAAQWDIEEVCKFVSSVTGCSEYCDVFREQEIDGQALILLSEEHLSNKMGLKLGPALKLKSKIDELRCVYSK